MVINNYLTSFIKDFQFNAGYVVHSLEKVWLFSVPLHPMLIQHYNVKIIFFIIILLNSNTNVYVITT